MAHAERDGRGLEIGPSHSPVASKKAGYNVSVLDHLDRDGLVKKYQGHGVDLDSIEEVDFVWSGEPYEELVGGRSLFDWIIASHVIEHTPDLVSFLRDCETILRDDGVLSLAIPDKRYCFDAFRPITGISAIVDAYFEKRRTHSPGSAAEFYLNVISKGGRIAWDEEEKGSVEFIHSAAEAAKFMENARIGDPTIDLHSWSFVPSSFRLLVRDLGELGLIGLKEQSFSGTSGSEFYMTLCKTRCNSSATDVPSRLCLLESIESELRLG